VRSDARLRIVSCKLQLQGTSISRVCAAKWLSTALLARLFQSDDAPRALKGGYAMELQLRVARTTVDIDLTPPASLSLPSEEAPATGAVREMLQEAASLDLGDWFVYTVGAPMMDLDAAPAVRVIPSSLAGFSLIHPCSMQKLKNAMIRWC
jgi:hypothetical protein